MTYLSTCVVNGETQVLPKNNLPCVLDIFPKTGKHAHWRYLCHCWYMGMTDHSLGLDLNHCLMLAEPPSTSISILTIKHWFIIWLFKFVPLSKLQETSIILAAQEHKTGKTKFKLETRESQKSLVWIQDAVIFRLVFSTLLGHKIEQWIQHKEHQRDLFSL